MPEGNMGAYKEMYEMGQRLMAMAEAGGYSPGSEESTDESSDEESVEGNESYGSRDKVKTALSFLGR